MNSIKCRVLSMPNHHVDLSSVAGHVTVVAGVAALTMLDGLRSRDPAILAARWMTALPKPEADIECRDGASSDHASQRPVTEPPSLQHGPRDGVPNMMEGTVGPSGSSQEAVQLGNISEPNPGATERM